MPPHKYRQVFILIFLILLLCSCKTGTQKISNTPSVVASPSPENTSTINQPTMGAPIDKASSQSQIYIDTLQINILESSPLQVTVTIIGNLPDGCTSIVGHKITQSDQWKFNIQIITKHDDQNLCTQALVPFEQTIPLDVNGLPAGTYMVKIYDLSETFTFKQDN